GAETTPHTATPSRSSAISVAQTGIPRAKLRVPSIGSSTQRAPPSVAPCSSPSTPSLGRSAASRLRSACSTAWSASVTGLLSAFSMTRRSWAPNRGRLVESARSASSSASAGSAEGIPQAYAVGSGRGQLDRPHRHVDQVAGANHGRRLRPVDRLARQQALEILGALDRSTVQGDDDVLGTKAGGGSGAPRRDVDQLDADRVARVEGGIRLDDVVDDAHGAARPGGQRPAERGDDARGDGAGEPMRIADGHHQLADAQRRRIAELGGRQTGALDADHREVAE